MQETEVVSCKGHQIPNDETTCTVWNRRNKFPLVAYWLDSWAAFLRIAGYML